MQGAASAVLPLRRWLLLLLSVHCLWRHEQWWLSLTLLFTDLFRVLVISRILLQLCSHRRLQQHLLLVVVLLSVSLLGRPVSSGPRHDLLLLSAHLAESMLLHRHPFFLLFMRFLRLFRRVINAILLLLLLGGMDSEWVQLEEEVAEATSHIDLLLVRAETTTFDTARACCSRLMSDTLMVLPHVGSTGTENVFTALLLLLSNNLMLLDRFLVQSLFSNG